MSVLEAIRAQMALPCTIRQSGAGRLQVTGRTEELARESASLIVYSKAALAWLSPYADIVIAVELPFSGHFTPRVLECAATITRLVTGKQTLQVRARVNRMIFADKKCEPSLERPIDLFKSGTAAGRGRAIAKHSTIQSNSEGEQTMSFLKSFIREEEGQGMVEYGLILGLVVFAAVAAWQGFSTALNNGIGTQKTNLTTDMGS